MGDLHFGATAQHDNSNKKLRHIEWHTAPTYGQVGSYCSSSSGRGSGTRLRHLITPACNSNVTESPSVRRRQALFASNTATNSFLFSHQHNTRTVVNCRHISVFQLKSVC